MLTKLLPETRAAVVAGSALPLCLVVPSLFDAMCASVLFLAGLILCRFFSWGIRFIWPRSWHWFVTIFSLAVALQLIALAGNAYFDTWTESSPVVIPAVLVSALVWAGFGLMRKNVARARLTTLAGIVTLVLACGAFREYAATPNTLFAGIFLIVTLIASLLLLTAVKWRAS